MTFFTIRGRSLSVVATVRILGVVVLGSFLLSSYALLSQARSERQARINACESRNRTAAESNRSLRPAVRLALLLHDGVWDSIVDQIRDADILDCDTGLPIEQEGEEP